MTSAEAPSGRANRRLAAVLHADVAGFSRLMATDEVGTHERLILWRDLIYHELARHGGRVVGTAGDAVLAVFDSVVDALSAAVAIQSALGEKNAPLPQSEQLHFRIGLNLGDIIVDGEDIFGNGVNVAARVEALADPGGIAVTSAVRDQVGNKLPLVFEDRGSHQVKNIDAPLHVFAVHRASDAPEPVPPRKKVSVSRLAVVLVSCAVLLAFGVFWFAAHEEQTTDGAKTAGTTDAATLPAAPLQPTIAVLPFDNRATTADQSYFSDGVTEDVIAALGRFSGLLVLSWNAVASTEGQLGSATQRALALGADYFVSGSVQRSDTRIRLSVQLSEASTGVLIWSDRYDEDVIDLFEVQDRLTRQVVAALAVRVTQAEEARVAVAPTDSLSAYDLVLRGRDLMRRIDRAANLEARSHFERSLELDPRYADAFAELGYTHLNDLKFGWVQWPEQALQAARSNADQAIAIDPLNARAYSLKAAILKYEGQLEEAERTIDKSLSLNPNNAQSHAERCSILMFAGQPEKAIPAAEMSLKIDPYPRADQVNCPIAAFYLLGQFDEVTALAKRFPLQSSEEAASLFLRAAAHAMLGEQEEAERLAAAGLARYPFFNVNSFAQIFTRDEHRPLVVEGLRKAGLE